MWRRVEEGEHDWRGESGRRIRLGKKRGEGEQQPGSGAYWVKENKTCHLAKERRGEPYARRQGWRGGGGVVWWEGGAGTAV